MRTIEIGGRCLAAPLAAAGLPLSLAGSAAAEPVHSVTGFIGGTTPGVSAGQDSLGITTGPDGKVWFAEEQDRDVLGRVNADGSVTEFTGGATPGFAKNGYPNGVVTGPDGNIWFTQRPDPGRFGRVNADGTLTELTGGKTPGFGAHPRLSGEFRPSRPPRRIRPDNTNGGAR